MEGDQNEMYRECLRNHAASLGSYATDGCGEFTPDDITTSVGGGGGGGLICAACGCHRNFHRKVLTRQALQLDAAAAEEMIDYGGGRPAAATAYSPHSSSERSSKKRHRTKFTEEQKEKMMGFAEKLEWRLQRPKDVEEDEIERFCRGVGISRKVFKVWMHNHKNNNNSNNNNNNSTNNSHSGNNASSLTQDQ